MKQIIRYFLLFSVLSMGMETAMAQTQVFKERHEVKRKETIFGIARDNGLTVQELINANPEMNTPGYELKKGTMINIPYPAKKEPAPAAAASDLLAAKVDMRQREIRVGVMLPLHTWNGDGKRMLEYYRGVLMACDSLRAGGVSTDIRAWNVPEDADIRETLKDPAAADRDLIIGPLYSKQVKDLGDFAKAHGTRVLIPFSINTTELYDNPYIFQVFQNGNMLNDAFVYRFSQRFKGCHPIIIDCNDSTSTKGPFTTALRRKLEQDGVTYDITNLKQTEASFKKCFSTTQRNVVVLNTSRSKELSVAFAKLNGLLIQNPQLKISMFGYPEWLMYTRQHLDNYYKFDVHVPSTYYMDPVSPRTERLRLKYRWNFHQDMQNYHQNFAATGFDQGFFFIKGLHLYGPHFTGSAGMVGYTPFQTPLNFERIGNGGLQNRTVMLVHYTNNQRVETIKY